MSEPTPTTPECDGMCLTGSDVGVPSAQIAYPHPGCPLHAPGERCECGQPDRCNSYTHDPAWLAAQPAPESEHCRCRPLGMHPNGEEPADFDATDCRLHVMPELPVDFQDDGEPF